MWNSAIKVKNQWRKQKPYYPVFQWSCYLMWWNDNSTTEKPIHQVGGGLQRLPACLKLDAETCSLVCRPGFQRPGMARPASPSHTWGDVFQGHNHPKLMENVLAHWVPISWFFSLFPQTLNAAVRPALCLSYGTCHQFQGLSCFWRQVLLQSVCGQRMDYGGCWVILSVVSEASTRDEGLGGVIPLLR